MKKIISNILFRGLIACGFGPLILAVIYWALYKNGVHSTLSAQEVCLGIFSSAALAFIAGGCNGIYQIERLPIMPAVLIHGIILYLSYLGVYLINGWIKWGKEPISIFSIIFVVGYVIIWAVILGVTKMRTKRINAILRIKQEAEAAK